MRAALALLAAGAAALLAGCTPTSTTPQNDMLATVDSFLADCAQGSPSRALDELNTTARDQFLQAPSVAQGCATILQVPAVAATTLTRSDFADSTARVRTYRGGDGTVAVTLKGVRLPAVRLTYGIEFWQIEGATH